MWPFDFSLVYTVKLSADTIETQLRVHNIGTQAFDFNTLLHTYFLIPVSLSCLVFEVIHKILTDSVLLSFRMQLRSESLV